MSGTETNVNKNIEQLKLSVKGFIHGKYGELLTQENLSAVLNITRGAVANLPEAEMPRTKNGESRTDRVYYKIDDVVNYLVKRILVQRKV